MLAERQMIQVKYHWKNKSNAARCSAQDIKVCNEGEWDRVPKANYADYNYGRTSTKSWFHAMLADHGKAIENFR